MDEKQRNIAREELIQDLSDLRQKLKDREKRKTGRTPQVCSDESIRIMVDLKPRKPSDFYSIPGIGPAFVERYANDFLQILNDDEEAPVELDASVSKNEEETLRELSKKLININKNNIIIYK